MVCSERYIMIAELKSFFTKISGPSAQLSRVGALLDSFRGIQSRDLEPCIILLTLIFIVLVIASNKKRSNANTLKYSFSRMFRLISLKN
jgi:hypothetical protein